MPRQSSHSKASASSSPSPPPWLGLVKRAIVVMSVLIVVGLGLLVYGVVNQVGRLAPTTPASPFSQTSTLPEGIAHTLRIPQGFTLIAHDTMADGRVLLRFASPNASEDGNSGGEGVIIILAPDLKAIVARLRFAPHNDTSAGAAGDFVIED